ncbi:MAG TPA: cysteine--tRNA ligase [Candidatus Microsaccharimonas sp.]|jgi:cysteinyl-tRNA synthetase
MSLQFHNQLSKKVDLFTPQVAGKVSLYTCGPTVYNYLHVGNWTAYIYWDILVRVLQANNLQVDRVMNITDVGHLVSDADDGEDKLEKGARREGKTAWEVAAFYTEDFLKGMNRLNLIAPTHITKATNYIEEQLQLVRVLKEKGFTYQIDDGIYFDTAKFPTYDDFADLHLDAQKAGARVEFNPEKRNHSDFALWKFTPAGETRDMEWETPADLLDIESEETSAARVSAAAYATETRSEAVSDDSHIQKVDRMGFPGWHLECSAMAMSLLGETLDLHTGGIDHIPVHHTNEIAQSEAATGKIFANYWMHNNHLKVNGTKISKSLDNGYTLDDLEAKGYSPMELRMFVLQSHYRSEGNFTFENLDGAKNRLRNWRTIAALRHQTHDRLRDDNEKSTDDHSVSLYASSQALVEALSNDLDTPAAFAIIDEAFSKLEGINIEDIHHHALQTFLETIDSLLGLQLLDTTKDISDDLKRLIIERERARENRDWNAADQLRLEIEKSGITVRDTAHGSIWEYSV